MKVAVTGDQGFLGKYVIDLLKREDFVITGFDRTKHDLLGPKTLIDFVSGKDVIIHLAAVNRGIEKEIMRVNALGTKNLLEAIKEYAPMTKLIFASTFQVYIKDGVYGNSKKQAEKYINYFSKKYGIKSIILRIANIYGPGCKPYYNSVIATFVHRIKQGEPLVINGDGTQKRDYIYVLDVAKAIAQSISYEPETAEYFDICSGKEIRLNTIVGYLRELSKKNIEVVYNKRVELYNFGIKKNYKKAEKVLGWSPTVSLREGLEETLK